MLLFLFGKRMPTQFHSTTCHPHFQDMEKTEKTKSWKTENYPIMTQYFPDIISIIKA